MGKTVTIPDLTCAQSLLSEIKYIYIYIYTVIIYYTFKKFDKPYDNVDDSGILQLNI